MANPFSPLVLASVAIGLVGAVTMKMLDDKRLWSRDSRGALKPNRLAIFAHAAIVIGLVGVIIGCVLK